ncbi:hypothetical protein AKJ09_11125 [Labilithrix luteola]|uniref:Uncharacterized protein n=2 Tax=Labilithrix luteola TaxID=1391654 RepID=A0A0K1QFM7_9BACT|nr:hypothetical protein AKJ09_11125 [Labilithrix luteola]
MQVEFSAFDRTPPDFLKACFAVHTKGGGWTWHWNKVPIVIDYGQPDVVAPGAGHFEFDIKTDNVDLVAISLVKDAGMSLTKVTYTAIPSPAR